jgi:Domain of unknown function (DUF4234)
MTAPEYPPPGPAPQPGVPQYAYGQQQPPPPPPPAWQAMPGVPAGMQYAQPMGPIGRTRPTGLTMLLFFVTLGIWGIVYYYQTQEEMKQHSGEGVGGVIALVIAIFAGFVSPFLLSHEVGRLYERRGQQPPVSAVTGLWVIPGFLILVGPFIWFVQTNRALNDYWQSLGAPPP